MANPFPRTLRSLDGERSPAVLLLLGALVLLLVLWAAWFVRSSLPVYVVSATARLEAQRAVYPISAQVGGRVRRVAVTVGQPVAPGDVLIELEADSENRRLEEERAKNPARWAKRQLESRRGERGEPGGGGPRGGRAGRRAVAPGAQAQRLRGADASVVAAEGDLRRKEQLHAGGLARRRADVEQARAESERRQAAAAELRLTLDRLEAERQRDQSDRRALLEGVDRESALLAGDLAAGGAALRRLAFEGQWRTIRAPVGGQVADLARLDAGALIQPGERLGTVIPASPAVGQRRGLIPRRPRGACGRGRRRRCGWTPFRGPSTAPSRRGWRGSRASCARGGCGPISTSRRTRARASRGSTG